MSQIQPKKRIYKKNIFRWNQLDMFIVILSIAGIIFEDFEALELPNNPTIIRVMRVLRIARGESASHLKQN